VNELKYRLFQGMTLPVSTAYISHPDCHDHDTGEGHPECAQRLSAIEDKFIATSLWDFLRGVDAPEATDAQLLRVHTARHLENMQKMMPQKGLMRLDQDTVISPDSMKAARRAAGSVVAAVDLLMSGNMKNAFCGVRPPGHHAESARALGFCLFNNIAVGAAHAMEEYGLEKIAVLDFDVHQGNGTEDIFIEDERVLYCSIFQHPFYPFTTPPKNNEHVVSIPLDATAKSEEFRAAITDHWLPALKRFQPKMIFVSAGFDAHRDDEMSYVSLTDADFRWVAEQIVEMAEVSAQGRVVSVLEGGYELHSLARCVETHMRVLMGL
jgi:acetoin utilization deacetylase AcuC-like enzyme